MHHSTLLGVCCFEVGSVEDVYLHRQIMRQNGVLGDRILESYAGVDVIQLFELKR